MNWLKRLLGWDAESGKAMEQMQVRDKQVHSKVDAELKHHSDLVLAFALVDKAMVGKKSARKRKGE